MNYTNKLKKKYIMKKNISSKNRIKNIIHFITKIYAEGALQCQDLTRIYKTVLLIFGFVKITVLQIIKIDFIK